VDTRPFAVPILRASVPPCLRERIQAAFDKGDKVTDKVRDKVAASPEGARYTSPGQRPGEWSEIQTSPEGAGYSHVTRRRSAGCKPLSIGVACRAC